MVNEIGQPANNDGIPLQNNSPKKKSKLGSAFTATVIDSSNADSSKTQEVQKVNIAASTTITVGSQKIEESKLQEKHEVQNMQKAVSETVETVKVDLDTNEHDIEHQLGQLVDVLPDGTVVASRVNCAQNEDLKKLREEAKDKFSQETDPKKVKVRDNDVAHAAKKFIKCSPEDKSAAVHPDILKQYPNAKRVIFIEDLPAGMKWQDLSKMDLKNPPAGLKFKDVHAMSEKEQKQVNKLLRNHAKLHAKLHIYRQNTANPARMTKQSTSDIENDANKPSVTQNIIVKKVEPRTTRGSENNPTANFISVALSSMAQTMGKTKQKEAEQFNQTRNFQDKQRLENERKTHDELIGRENKQDNAYREKQSNIDRDNKILSEKQAPTLNDEELKVVEYPENTQGKTDQKTKKIVSKQGRSKREIVSGE